jgi:hypothetical protein
MSLENVDYTYKIESETELQEAKWLIQQGFYKDMDDYISRITRMEIRIMKRKATERKKATNPTKKRIIGAVKKNKAA